MLTVFGVLMSYHKEVESRNNKLQMVFTETIPSGSNTRTKRNKTSLTLISSLRYSSCSCFKLAFLTVSTPFTAICFHRHKFVSIHGLVFLQNLVHFWYADWLADIWNAVWPVIPGKCSCKERSDWLNQNMLYTREGFYHENHTNIKISCKYHDTLFQNAIRTYTIKTCWIAK